MHYLVYITINNITGERYIGQHKTKNLNDDYLGSGKLLQKNINKYGKENFERITLYEADCFEDMNNLEIVFIDLYEPELNISKGGDGGWDYVNKERLWETEKWRKARKDNWRKATSKFQWLMKNDEEFRKNMIQKLMNASKESIKKRKAEGTYKNAFFKYSKSELHKTRARNNALKRNLWQGQNNPAYGKKWMYNDKESLLVKKEDIQSFLDKGYLFGRKLNKNNAL